MSIRDDEAARRVRFGATLAAVGHAVRIAAPALLIAWAAIFAIRGVPLLLQLNRIAVPPLPFGPIHWSTTLPTVAATILVSGLLTRWLLAPTPAALRPDWRLAAYVGVLVLAYAVPTLLTAALIERPIASSVASIVISLVFALFALWPIAILTGDPVGIGAAAARMRQAYFTYAGLYVLSGLPAAIFLGGRLLTGRGPVRELAERMVYGAVSTVVTVLIAVVLAQIYSRRVRACDLGETSPERLREVFD